MEAAMVRPTVIYGLMVTVMIFEVAGFPVAQELFESRTQLTWLPSLSGVRNVELFGPTPIPFISHWKRGVVPPFTGIAVKVITCPWHAGFWSGVMVTETGRMVLTFIVTALDVAGLPVEQLIADVKTQVTMSPVTGR
jgi:hypothetical protein